jgi:hypothetical protein
MTRQILPEVYARALESAEDLKRRLEAQLIGRTARASSCSCGGCSNGPSEVVAINIPGDDGIAMWPDWDCKMKDDKGKLWSQALSAYIPSTVLYPMFRNQFAGIDVEVDHPKARLYHYYTDGLEWDCESAKGQPKFTAAYRTMTVSKANAAFVRPIGDLSHAVWLNAEIRIDHSPWPYVNSGPMLACNVNPFEFGQSRGREAGQYYDLSASCERPAFFIRIPGDGHGPDQYFPIARQVSITESTGEATFELDQSVESFQPVAPSSIFVSAKTHS